ncbi:MAG TPA: DUF2062 domain-containing protein [Geminicoccaceae bacterium]|nr:DUF2062 domain-containing protein [Geminicoccaceae bacterium]
MFRRRVALSLLQKLRGWVWPAGGWRRAGRYVAKRVVRMSGTPHSIAIGLAAGVAVSFTPFIGFHILLACLICLPFRGNVIAAAIGTAVGNPWTFPFIWVWIYTFGRWLLGDAAPAPTLRELTPGLIFDRPWTVLWPMVVGSIPTAIVAGVASYVPLVRAVAAYQEARRRRKARRRVELGLPAAAAPRGELGGPSSGEASSDAGVG